MNILDYTYDLNRIEKNFEGIELAGEIKSLRSFLSTDFTKEELVEKVIDVLLSLPELESINEDYYYGEGYLKGYEEGKLTSK